MPLVALALGGAMISAATAAVQSQRQATQAKRNTALSNKLVDEASKLDEAQRNYDRVSMPNSLAEKRAKISAEKELKSARSNYDTAAKNLNSI